MSAYWMYDLETQADYAEPPAPEPKPTRKLTQKQLKMETCGHYRAVQSGPSTGKGGGGWRTPHHCPDCGFKWIEEAPRPQQGRWKVSDWQPGHEDQ